MGVNPTRPHYRKPDTDLVALCEIDVMGPHFGQATVAEMINGNGPKIGDAAFVVPKVRDILMGDDEGPWLRGDYIVLSLRRADDPGKNPWVAIHANVRHAKNARQPRLTVEEQAKSFMANSYPNYVGRLTKIVEQAVDAGLTKAEIRDDPECAAAVKTAREALQSGNDNRGVAINMAIGDLKSRCAAMVTIRKMRDHDAEAAEQINVLLEDPVEVAAE